MIFHVFWSWGWQKDVDAECLPFQSFKLWQSGVKRNLTATFLGLASLFLVKANIGFSLGYDEGLDP